MSAKVFIKMKGDHLSYFSLSNVSHQIITQPLSFVHVYTCGTHATVNQLGPAAWHRSTHHHDTFVTNYNIDDKITITEKSKSQSVRIKFPNTNDTQYGRR